MNYFLSFTLVTSFLTCGLEVESKSELRGLKNAHKPLQLSERELMTLASLTDTRDFERSLDEILVPRVVGTPQHQRVADFIVGRLEDLGWTAQREAFRDETPIFGTLDFENIIGWLNPNADRYLVLACHYDSKYMREHNFVGATDSAVPCSMMLNLAHTLAPYLSPMRNDKNLSLALVFFDGEEAFHQWGPTDSIYGARNLAAKWQGAQYTTAAGSATNFNDRIDVMMLLDLIGAPQPTFYSYFPNTKRWYDLLWRAENRLARMGMLQNRNGQYFSSRSVGAHIEDDHIPFLKRDVRILHIIPSPFPPDWHRPSDDRSSLDMATIENLNKIFRIFVAQYLHLQL